MNWSSLLLYGGYQLSWSTVGFTPSGVAMLTPSPPSVNASCASMNSLAQKPVGCGDPSFIVQTVAPVRTTSASATAIAPFDSMEAYVVAWILSNAFRGTLLRTWRLVGGAHRLVLSGKGVQFGRHVGGFGRADPLEDLQRLPQPGFGLGGAAIGQGAPAQAGQRLSLVPGAVDLAGQ